MQRRDFLKAMGASVAGAGCRTPSATDLATPFPAGIDHIVFVMMENRTFDHYFGSLSLTGERPVDGLSTTLEIPSPQGLHRPFPLHSQWCLDDPPHGWSSSHRQFNDGANDGFAAEYHARWGQDADAGLVMGYHTRDTLPVLYSMADHYVLCDQWFCSLLAPTWPNRLFSHGAQSQGATSNDLPAGQFTMRTIWDQLEEAGVSWGYYYSDLPFIGLFNNASHWVPDGRVTGIEAFYEAAAQGTLPAVSYVEPAFSFNDDHPPHHPMLGQMFLATVHNALASSPQWNRTLFVITYDEHGGFYDHVPPPTIPDDNEAAGFGQLGFRVPAIVGGPWVRGGSVDSTLYSHSSWLKEVQRQHGLDPLTLRNASVSDLSAALDLDRTQPLEPAVLPVIEMTEEEVELSCNSDRSANQPELEDFVRRQCPELDLRKDPVALARDHIAWGERFGACIVR